MENLAFAYDADNRITHIANGIDGTLTQSLGYDAMNRLTTLASTADNESFRYDADGNRTQHVLNGTVITFTPDTHSNRLISTATSSGSGTFGYDADGNTLTYNGNTLFVYSPFGLVSGANGIWDYANGAEGQRLRNTNSQAKTQTYFAPDKSGVPLAEDQGGIWLDYVYLNGRQVSVVKNGQIYSVHADQTGRPLALTAATRAVVWETVDLPYPISNQITVNTFGAFNLEYPGQYQDSGIVHNGLRDYNAYLGRYMQSDPIGLAGGTNTYAYVGNNPITGIDPLGLDSAVFYTEPQYQMGLSGTGLQFPDVYLFEVGLGSVSFSATYTKYGDAFVGFSGNPTAIAQGNGLQIGGVQIAAGYVKGCDDSRQTINNIVSGVSGGASYYDAVGGGFSNNASGTIVYGGVGFGQFTAGTGYNQYQGNISGH